MDIKELNAAESNAHHPWEYARFDIIFSMFKKYKPKNTKNIFDVGCGDTFFMEKFHDRFPEAAYHGVDIAFNDESIATCEKRFKDKNISVYKDLENIDIKNVKADIVLLLDVIEHIEDDKDFLKNLHKHPSITKNTQLYISVPAFQKLFVSRDTWLGHFRRYTLRGLKKTVSDCGFTPIKSRYLFFYLLFPRFFTLLKEQIIKPEANSIKGIGGYSKKPIFDFLFISILKIDFLISGLFNYFGLKLPGLSCFVLCKKQ